jgi:hypothetical protein
VAYWHHDELADCMLTLENDVPTQALFHVPLRTRAEYTLVDPSMTLLGWLDVRYKLSDPVSHLPDVNETVAVVKLSPSVADKVNAKHLPTMKASQTVAEYIADLHDKCFKDVLVHKPTPLRTLSPFFRSKSPKPSEPAVIVESLRPNVLLFKQLVETLQRHVLELDTRTFELAVFLMELHVPSRKFVSTFLVRVNIPPNYPDSPVAIAVEHCTKLQQDTTQQRHLAASATDTVYPTKSDPSPAKTVQLLKANMLTLMRHLDKDKESLNPFADRSTPAAPTINLGRATPSPARDDIFSDRLPALTPNYFNTRK